MNKKQLLAYKVALDDAYDQKKAEQVKKELLSQVTEKDKLKKEFWPLFEDGTCTVGTPDFNLILANIPTFEKNIGKEKLDEFLFSAYSRALSPHLYGNKERQTVSLDELKQQIGKLDLQKKNDLLSLCDIAGLVAQGDVNQLVSKVEENAATLTGNDLSSMLMAFGAMRDKATKADYNRMVAAAEKMMANPANSEMKNYLEYYVESWKNLAHVGVNFQDLTFEQAVEKAAKMRKQIFVDCYTSWCGPCKYMSNTVFPQEKMGDYMNPKFICVKYDMENLKKVKGLRNKMHLREIARGAEKQGFEVENFKDTLLRRIISKIKNRSYELETKEEPKRIADGNKEEKIILRPKTSKEKNKDLSMDNKIRPNMHLHGKLKDKISDYRNNWLLKRSETFKKRSEKYDDMHKKTQDKIFDIINKENKEQGQNQSMKFDKFGNRVTKTPEEIKAEKRAKDISEKALKSIHEQQREEVK